MKGQKNKRRRTMTINIFNPDFKNLHNDLKFCIVNKVIGVSSDSHEWILCKIKKEKISEYADSDVVVTQAFVGVNFFTGDKEMMTQFEKNIKRFMTDNFPEAYI